ncbi:MAG: hypothetical protein AB4042_07085 [Leptolyngbyaceae cyanobacterium]
MSTESKSTPSNDSLPSSSRSASSASQGKTVFLLASMVGWLLVGGALIYLAPVMANRFFHSDTTELWMETLSRSGYDPMVAIAGGSVAFVITVIAQVIWAPKFGQTR